MTYLIDSHTLFWFFTDDKRLSKNSKEILDEAEEGKVNIIIPSIIVLELMSILEKKNLEEYFDEILKKLKEGVNYGVYPLDVEIIEIVFCIISMRELHDRIIIATAKLLNCPIITKDEEIINSKEIECIW